MPFLYTHFLINLFSASVFLQQNIVALIEGSNSKISACALSTVTGIPLIRLHGNSRPLDQCEHTIQISAGYKAYAHATLDILNTFQWTKIALVFDGKKWEYFINNKSENIYATSGTNTLLIYREM